jgi:hypothetical protein
MTVTDRIVRVIRAHGRGWVFSPADFDRPGAGASRAAIDQTLSRLTRAGVIRRVARGVYDYPRINPRFGAISPSPDAVARAVARKTGSKLQVGGAQAANALGLSTQVPAHAVYFTDGPSRRVPVGRSVVTLRHTSPRYMIGAGRPAGTVVQALRYLGPDVPPDALDRVANQLSSADRQVLVRRGALAPNSIRPALDRIVQAGTTSAA